jgi:hypothetical protein
MDQLSRVLATARIDDLHRRAAPGHMIRLARSVTREPRMATERRVPIVRWTRRRDGRSRRDRVPMQQEPTGDRS